MINRAEFLIAYRYFKTKRKEKFIAASTAFSFAGVALGVAALIVVLAVMKGFHIELQSKILGTNGHITIKSSENFIKDYDIYANDITKNPHVLKIFPTIESELLLSYNNISTGAFLKAISKNDLPHKEIIADNLIIGDINSFGEDDNVFIGIDLAKKLKANIGDKVTLIAPQASMTVLGMIPRHKDYTVAGIFETGIYQYDYITIIMPLDKAQVFLNLRDSVISLELFVDNIENTDRIVRELAKTLPNTFMLYDWKHSNPLLNALEVERTVMITILTLIILVAAFNIISSLIMLVKEKTFDIAILRTIGISRAAIMRIFLMVGFSIGFLGTLIGTAIGLLIACNLNSIKNLLESLTGNKLFDPFIYYLTQLPAKVYASDVLAICSLSLVISLLASFYPAWRASQYEPIEILKND